jgi:hypothetical protein
MDRNRQVFVGEVVEVVESRAEILDRFWDHNVSLFRPGTFGVRPTRMGVVDAGWMSLGTR